MTDESGAPIPGARVTATPVGRGDAVTSTTNRGGRYEVGGPLRGCS
ncbi:MAG: carboxypeptidase-like regulatory domain-containing protein [Planctomycetota bacterium]